MALALGTFREIPYPAPGAGPDALGLWTDAWGAQGSSVRALKWLRWSVTRSHTLVRSEHGGDQGAGKGL